jgi:hypothetical protein
VAGKKTGRCFAPRNYLIAKSVLQQAGKTRKPEEYSFQSMKMLGEPLKRRRGGQNAPEAERRQKRKSANRLRYGAYPDISDLAIEPEAESGSLYSWALASQDLNLEERLCWPPSGLFWSDSMRGTLILAFFSSWSPQLLRTGLDHSFRSSLALHL